MNGYTAESPKHFMLDSGAFYKNFDMATDTVATAAAKLLGLTRGGGEFSAVPTIRAIVADGIKENTTGFKRIDNWVVTLKGTMLEMTTANFQALLATSEVDSTTDPTYDAITAKSEIALEDYLTNITYIGTISGSTLPVIIQVSNAINLQGLTLASEDKNEGTMEALFTGHYGPTTQGVVPFTIYNPKITGDTVPPTVTVAPADLETTVALNSAIIWTFSEAISNVSVNSANFFLLEAGVPVAGALTQSFDKLTVTFTPITDLITATEYTALATTNIKDISGNSLVQNNIINFTTV